MTHLLGAGRLEEGCALAIRKIQRRILYASGRGEESGGSGAGVCGLVMAWWHVSDNGVRRRPQPTQCATSRNVNEEERCAVLPNMGAKDASPHAVEADADAAQVGDLAHTLVARSAAVVLGRGLRHLGGVACAPDAFKLCLLHVYCVYNTT